MAIASAFQPLAASQFDTSYNGNILVNAIALGQQRPHFPVRGHRPEIQSFVFGAKTGRDGIHGATMASAEFFR